MEIDRLSNLPDDMIQEVLSRLDSTKEAVRTCVLSKNWTNRWTRVHSLSFDRRSFTTRRAYKEFVLHVLRHRQPSIKIRELRFFCGENQNHSSFINGVFDQAILPELELLDTDLCNLPPSLVGCQTLKTLYFQPLPYQYMALSSNSFNFAWLKNLHLCCLTIDTNGPDDDIFSSCMNLVNLTLATCDVHNTEVFNINAPRLEQLIIANNVYGGEIKISAPKLKRFEYCRLAMSRLGELVINEDVTLDEVTMEMSTCHFVSREEIQKLREYVSDLTERLQWRTKSFSVSLNYYVDRNLLAFVKGEIKSVRGPFDKEIKYIEHEKKYDGQSTDVLWI